MTVFLSSPAHACAGINLSHRPPADSRPAFGGHPRGWVYIDPPEPQFLQLPLCETSSYTAAAPTSTYTSDSTGGQLPRSIATTFQSPPRKSPTPRRPQFKAPTMTSIQATMCKFFILLNSEKRLASKVDPLEAPHQYAPVHEPRYLVIHLIYATG